MSKKCSTPSPHKKTIAGMYLHAGKKPSPHKGGGGVPSHSNLKITK